MLEMQLFARWRETKKLPHANETTFMRFMNISCYSLWSCDEIEASPALKSEGLMPNLRLKWL